MKNMKYYKYKNNKVMRNDSMFSLLLLSSLKNELLWIKVIQSVKIRQYVT